MKNPFQTKKMHVVSDDLTSMQTVTTISLFGFVIYRTTEIQSVSVSLF